MQVYKSMDELHKVMIYILGRIAGIMRFHHATEKGMQSKIYELFSSGTFHLIFSDRSWLQVTESMGSEVVEWGGDSSVT